MAEFEDKLNSILSNPALMSQIMSMAGSLGETQSQPAAPTPPAQPAFQQQAQFQSQPQYQAQPQSQNSGGLPFDPAAMQGMMQLLKSTQIDQKQMNLVKALEGFLPDDRRQKLVKAMQAAKIAKYASSALSQSR